MAFTYQPNEGFRFAIPNGQQLTIRGGRLLPAESISGHFVAPEKEIPEALKNAATEILTIWQNLGNQTYLTQGLKLPIETRSFDIEKAGRTKVTALVDAISFDNPYTSSKSNATTFVAAAIQKLGGRIDLQQKPLEDISFFDIPSKYADFTSIGKEPVVFDQFGKQHGLAGVLSLLEGFGGNITASQAIRGQQTDEDKRTQLAELIVQSLVPEADIFRTTQIDLYFPQESTLIDDSSFVATLKNKIKETFPNIQEENIRLLRNSDPISSASEILSNSTNLIWISTARIKEEQQAEEERKQQVSTQLEARRKIREKIIVGEPDETGWKEFIRSLVVNSSAGSGKTTTAVHHGVRAIDAITDYFYSLLALSNFLKEALEDTDQNIQRTKQELARELIQELKTISNMSPIMNIKDLTNIQASIGAIQRIDAIMEQKAKQNFPYLYHVWKAWYNKANSAQDQNRSLIALFDILQAISLLYEENIEPNLQDTSNPVDALKQLAEAIEERLIKRYIDPFFFSIAKLALNELKRQINQKFPNAGRLQQNIPQIKTIDHTKLTMIDPNNQPADLNQPYELGAFAYEIYGGKHEQIEIGGRTYPVWIVAFHSIGSPVPYTIFEARRGTNTFAYEQMGMPLWNPALESFARATASILSEQLAIAHDTIGSGQPNTALSTGQEIRKFTFEKSTERPFIVGSAYLHPISFHWQSYESYNRDRQKRLGEILWEMKYPKTQAQQTQQTQRQQQTDEDETLEEPTLTEPIDEETIEIIAPEQERQETETQTEEQPTSIYEQSKKHLPREIFSPLKHYIESDNAPNGIRLQEEVAISVGNEIEESIKTIAKLYLQRAKERIKTKKKMIEEYVVKTDARQKSRVYRSYFNDSEETDVRKTSARENTEKELDATRRIQTEIGKIIYYILTLDEETLTNPHIANKLGISPQAKGKLGKPNSDKRKQLAYTILTTFVKALEDIVYTEEFAIPYEMPEFSPQYRARLGIATKILPLNQNDIKIDFTPAERVEDVLQIIDQDHTDRPLIEKILIEASQARTSAIDALTKLIEHSMADKFTMWAKRSRLISYIAALSSHYQNPYFASQLVGNTLHYTSSFVAMTEHMAKQELANPYLTTLLPQQAEYIYKSKRIKIAPHVAIDVPEEITEIIYESFTPNGSSLKEAYERYMTIYGTLNAITYILQNPTMGGMAVYTDDFGNQRFATGMYLHELQDTLMLPNDTGTHLVQTGITYTYTIPFPPGGRIEQANYSPLYNPDYIDELVREIEVREAETKQMHPFSNTMMALHLHFYTAMGHLTQNLARIFPREANEQALVSMYKYYKEVVTPTIAQDITWRIGPYPDGFTEYWENNSNYYVLISTRTPTPTAILAGIPHPYKILNLSYQDNGRERLKDRANRTLERKQIKDSRTIENNIKEERLPELQAIVESTEVRENEQGRKERVIKPGGQRMFSWVKAPAGNRIYGPGILMVVPYGKEYDEQKIHKMLGSEPLLTEGETQSTIHPSTILKRAGRPTIIIDESQDMSYHHWLFYIYLIAGIKQFNPEARIIVFGDETQTIYSGLQNYRKREEEENFVKKEVSTLPTVRNPETGFGPAQVIDPKVNIIFGQNGPLNLSIIRAGRNTPIETVRDVKTDPETHRKQVENQAFLITNEIASTIHNGKAVNIGTIPNPFGISHTVYTYRNSEREISPEQIQQTIQNELYKKIVESPKARRHKHIIIEITTEDNLSETTQDPTTQQVTWRPAETIDSSITKLKRGLGLDDTTVQFIKNQDKRGAAGGVVYGRKENATTPIAPTQATFKVSDPKTLTRKRHNQEPHIVKIQITLPPLSMPPDQVFRVLVKQLEAAFQTLNLTDTVVPDRTQIGFHIISTLSKTKPQQADSQQAETSEQNETEKTQQEDNAREMELLMDELLKAIAFTTNKNLVSTDTPTTAYAYTIVYDKQAESSIRSIFEPIQEVFERRFVKSEVSNELYLAELALSVDLIMQTYSNPNIRNYLIQRAKTETPSIAILTGSNLEEHLAAALVGQWYKTHKDNEELTIPQEPPAVWNAHRSKGRQAKAVGVVGITNAMKGNPYVLYVALTRREVMNLLIQKDHNLSYTIIRYSQAKDLDRIYDELRASLGGKNAPSAQATLANWPAWTTTWFAQGSLEAYLSSLLGMASWIRIQMENAGHRYPDPSEMEKFIKFGLLSAYCQIGVDRKAEQRGIHYPQALQDQTNPQFFNQTDIMATILEACGDRPTVSELTTREEHPGLTKLITEEPSDKIAMMGINAQFIPLLPTNPERYEKAKGGTKWKTTIRANNRPDYDAENDGAIIEMDVYEMAPLNNGKPHDPTQWKRFLSPYLVTNLGISVSPEINRAIMPQIDPNKDEHLQLPLVIEQNDNSDPIRELKELINQTLEECIQKVETEAQKEPQYQSKSDGWYADTARKTLYELYDQIDSRTNIWKKLIVGIIIDGIWFNNEFTKAFRQANTTPENKTLLAEAIFETIYPRSIKSHKDITAQSLSEMMGSWLSITPDEDATPEITEELKQDEEYRSSAGDAAEEGIGDLEMDRLEKPFVASSSVGEDAFRRILQAGGEDADESKIIEELYKNAIDNPDQNVYSKLVNYNLAEPGALIEAASATYKDVARAFLESPSANFPHPLIRNGDTYIPAATTPVHLLATPGKYRKAMLKRLTRKDWTEDPYREEIEAIKGYWGAAIELLDPAKAKHYLVKELGEYAIISPEAVQERMSVLPDPIVLITMLVPTITAKISELEEITTQQQPEPTPTETDVTENLRNAESVTVTEGDTTEEVEQLEDDELNTEDELIPLIPETAEEIAAFMSAMTAFTNAWNGTQRTHLLRGKQQVRTTILDALEMAIQTLETQSKSPKIIKLFIEIKKEIEKALVDLRKGDQDIQQPPNKKRHRDKRGIRARIINTLLLYSLMSDFTRLVAVPGEFVRPPLINKYTRMPTLIAAGVTKGNVPPTYPFVAAMQGDYDGDKASIITSPRAINPEGTTYQNYYQEALRVIRETIQRAYTQNLFQGGSEHNFAPPTDAAAKYNQIMLMLGSYNPLKRRIDQNTTITAVLKGKPTEWKIETIHQGQRKELKLLEKQYTMPQFEAKPNQNALEAKLKTIKTETTQRLPTEITLLSTDETIIQQIKEVLAIPEGYEPPMDYHKTWTDQPANILNPIEYYGQIIKINIEGTDKYTTLAHLIYILQLTANLEEIIKLETKDPNRAEEELQTYIQVIFRAADEIGWFVNSENETPTPINRDSQIALDQKIKDEQNIGQNGLNRIRLAYHQTIAMHNNSPRSYDPEDFVKKAKAPKATDIRTDIGTPLVKQIIPNLEQKLKNAEIKIVETAVDAALVSAAGFAYAIKQKYKRLTEAGMKKAKTIKDLIIKPEDAISLDEETNLSNFFALVYEEVSRDKILVPFMNSVTIKRDDHEEKHEIKIDPNTTEVVHIITRTSIEQDGTVTETIEEKRYEDIRDLFGTPGALFYPDIASSYMRYATPDVDSATLIPEIEDDDQQQTSGAATRIRDMEIADPEFEDLYLESFMKLFEIKPFGMMNTIAYAHAIVMHEWLEKDLESEQLAALISPAYIVKGHMSLTRSDAANMKRWINIIKNMKVLETGTPIFKQYDRRTGMVTERRSAIGGFVAGTPLIIERIRAIRSTTDEYVKFENKNDEPVPIQYRSTDEYEWKKTIVENFQYVLEALQNIVGTTSNAARRYNAQRIKVSETLDCTLGNDPFRYKAHAACLFNGINIPIKTKPPNEPETIHIGKLTEQMKQEIHTSLESLRQYKIMHYPTSDGRKAIGEIKVNVKYKVNEEAKQKTIIIPIATNQEIENAIGFLDNQEMDSIYEAIEEQIKYLSSADFENAVANQLRQNEKPSETEQAPPQVEIESINLQSIALYTRTVTQCLVQKANPSEVCQTCAGVDAEGKDYQPGTTIPVSYAIPQGAIDGAKALIAAPHTNDQNPENGADRSTEANPVQQIQQSPIKCLIAKYAEEQQEEFTSKVSYDVLTGLLDEEAIIKEITKKTIKKRAEERRTSQYTNFYRSMALQEITSQLRENGYQTGSVSDPRTIFVYIPEEDITTERIHYLIENIRAFKNFCQTHGNKLNISDPIMINNIVIVVSNNGSETLVKRALEELEQANNPPNEIIGIVNASKLSTTTKTRYKFFIRRLLKIKDERIQKAQLTDDDMLAVILSDFIVTSSATYSSPKGKNMRRITNQIGIPASALDMTIKEEETEKSQQQEQQQQGNQQQQRQNQQQRQQNQQGQQAEQTRQDTTMHFKWRQFSLMRDEMQIAKLSSKIFSMIQQKEIDAPTARAVTSNGVLLLVADYKHRMTSKDQYEKFITRLYQRLEHEIWMATNAYARYYPRIEYQFLLQQLKQISIYDPFRHDTKIIGLKEFLEKELDNPEVVIGVLPNTRMPGNKHTVRPVTHRE